MIPGVSPLNLINQAVNLNCCLHSSCSKQGLNQVVASVCVQVFSRHFQSPEAKQLFNQVVNCTSTVGHAGPTCQDVTSGRLLQRGYETLQPLRGSSTMVLFGTCSRASGVLEWQLWRLLSVDLASRYLTDQKMPGLQQICLHTEDCAPSSLQHKLADLDRMVHSHNTSVIMLFQEPIFLPQSATC